MFETCSSQGPDLESAGFLACLSILRHPPPHYSNRPKPGAAITRVLARYLGASWVLECLCVPVNSINLDAGLPTVGPLTWIA